MESIFVSLMVWTAVTVTWTKGEIFEGIKTFIIDRTPWFMEEAVATLMYCAQCSGFWIGILGAFIIPPEWIPVNYHMAIFLHGFCISLTSIGADRIIYGRNQHTED